jgi:hypothetical protein
MPGFAAQQPEHDPCAVDDYTLVPAGRLHTLPDRVNVVAKVTDGNIAPDEIANLGRSSALPLPREAVGEPIRFTGYVIETCVNPKLSSRPTARG